MKALGFDAKKDEIRKIMYEIDKDTSERLNYEEFVQIMTARMV